MRNVPAIRKGSATDGALSNTMRFHRRRLEWVGCFTFAIVLITLGESPLSAQEVPRRPAKPNVILILADDFAIGDLGGIDGKPTRTPNLDRLASQSVRFTQAYSASCVCAPARAALLTGRYPHRSGVVTLNMEKFPELTRLHRDEKTIADRLSDAGYVTGLVGKWHIGRGKDYHPLRRGFDEFEGFDGSQVLSYFDYSLDINEKIVPQSGTYLTDDLSRRAIHFVKRHRRTPFFLHLAHYAPHRPLEAPVEIVKRYQAQGFDEPTATIYAMIQVMDHGIGQLLQALEEEGLAENTIVIFASDNGPDPLTGERFNRGLRGTKYQVYEGGIRVPLFVRWPQRVPPGRRDHLVHFVDLLPTILDLCEIEDASGLPIDGKSFAASLLNAEVPNATSRFWQWNRGEPNYTHNAAIRQGNHKLVLPYVTRGIRLKDSTLKPMLFDLQNDPSETTDIASDNRERVRVMHQQLEQWTNDIEQDRNRVIGRGKK